jgi:hypothetical protein
MHARRKKCSTEGRWKDKGCCGRKALKKLPALFIIHPVSQDWIIPRKTTAEINNTAKGRSRSEDQGSHQSAMLFSDYGRNTLKLHRYRRRNTRAHVHTHTQALAFEIFNVTVVSSRIMYIKYSTHALEELGNSLFIFKKSSRDDLPCSKYRGLNVI